MGTGSVISIFAEFTTKIFSLLSSLIPLVLVVGASLIGLAFGIRLVRRWIGGRK